MENLRIGKFADTENSSFGDRLRTMRKARGLTLAEVAEASGLAISTLSRVERGQMSPTYDKLLQLSKGLGVDIAELFGPQTPTAAGVVVTRAGEEQQVTTPNYDYRYLAARLAGKSMVPAAAKVKARSLAEFGPMLRHAGEEFLYVLAGRVTVHLEGREPEQLGCGESIYFDATQGHAFVNAGEGEAEILVVLAGDDRVR